MEYSKLVELYEKLESTTKRLQKTFEISKLLEKTSSEDLPDVTLMVQGRVFPQWDERKVGVASKLVIKAILKSTGKTEKKLNEIWKKTGDIGETAEQLTKGKTQATLFSKSLNVKKVAENLRKLASEEGQGSVDRKIGLVSELLSSASPKEAKYIARTVIEDLRVGVGEGSIRDAIVWAFFSKEAGVKYDEKEGKIEIEDRAVYNQYAEKVQKAYDLANDFGIVAKAAKLGEKALEGIGVVIGKPMKLILYPKAEDVENAFKIVGRPAAFEFKYDGFRMQVHKAKDEIRIFTRRLEDVTKQFKEIAKYIEENVNAKTFILDCEAVGFDTKTGKYRPFQEISQRIRRKYDIEKMAEELPVELIVFDIIELDGKNMVNYPFKERRAAIEKIVKQVPKKIILADQLITDDTAKADKFYKSALAKGNEGLMVKNLEGIYKPGRKVGYGVKLKPVMETLDLVIVGAEWGTGKRGGWLSSFTLACADEEGNLLEIGKVGTGIKEKSEEGVSFDEMTKMLKPLVISEEGREVKVKPRIVIEIEYEEIQKSPTYSSGFALRFPRVVKIRDDKAVSEINDIYDVEKLYKMQKKR